MARPQREPAAAKVVSEFDTHELAYLLGLASSRRRKRERDVPKIKDGQKASDFERVHERWKTSLAWARQIEDKLVLLVAARDQSLLHPGQRDRAYDLISGPQTSYIRCPDCGHIWGPANREPCPGCGMQLADLDGALVFIRRQPA